MARAQSFVDLQANLFLMEQELIDDIGGPPMAPTILKCVCTELCDCQDCIEEPLPTDGSINVRTLNWCPDSQQAQFIHYFIGQFGDNFYYMWPCGNSAQCHRPRVPLVKESQAARDFMEMMLNLEL
ncbi:unnamed protein product [Meganyctiphanes norvegica]|uniref:Uncharacterized protein n=1 Tax=Meganyctiphanes norvegica TaxID=48144 RepID=A0AAV2Q559_MEGNR